VHGGAGRSARSRARSAAPRAAGSRTTPRRPARTQRGKLRECPNERDQRDGGQSAGRRECRREWRPERWRVPLRLRTSEQHHGQVQRRKHEMPNVPSSLAGRSTSNRTASPNVTIPVAATDAAGVPKRSERRSSGDATSPTRAIANLCSITIKRCSVWERFRQHYSTLNRADEVKLDQEDVDRICRRVVNHGLDTQLVADQFEISRRRVQ